MIQIERHPPRRGRRTLWMGACALLLAPLVAMQVTREVIWTANDFLVFGTMLLAALGFYELAARKARSAVYRWAAGLTVGTAFFLVWANLAVGLIGSEDNPANLMFAGVLAVAFVGALAARLRARGMAYALFMTALAQMSVGIVAIAGALGVDGRGWPGDVIGLTGLFTCLWFAAALLFRRAAHHEMAA